MKLLILSIDAMFSEDVEKLKKYPRIAPFFDRAPRRAFFLLRVNQYYFNIFYALLQDVFEIFSKNAPRIPTNGAIFRHFLPFYKLLDILQDQAVSVGVCKAADCTPRR